MWTSSILPQRFWGVARRREQRTLAPFLREGFWSLGRSAERRGLNVQDKRGFLARDFAA